MFNNKKIFSPIGTNLLLSFVNKCESMIWRALANFLYFWGNFLNGNFFILKNHTLFFIMKTAEIVTNKGTLKVEFFEKDAPNTVKNFTDLAKKGFYDGLTFHRVIPDFVVQGGCPKGNGTGGPGYKIKCELDGENQYHDKGVLSMAHAGRDTGGSQFFIVLSRSNTAHLDRNHTCFGKVVEGLDIIDDLRMGDVMEKITVSEN